MDYKKTIKDTPFPHTPQKENNVLNVTVGPSPPPKENRRRCHCHQGTPSYFFRSTSASPAWQLEATDFQRKKGDDFTWCLLNHHGFGCCFLFLFLEIVTVLKPKPTWISWNTTDPRHHGSGGYSNCNSNLGIGWNSLKKKWWFDDAILYQCHFFNDPKNKSPSYNGGLKVPNNYNSAKERYLPCKFVFDHLQELIFRFPTVDGPIPANPVRVVKKNNAFFIFHNKSHIASFEKEKRHRLLKLTLFPKSSLCVCVCSPRLLFVNQKGTPQHLENSKNFIITQELFDPGVKFCWIGCMIDNLRLEGNKKKKQVDRNNFVDRQRCRPKARELSFIFDKGGCWSKHQQSNTNISKMPGNF